MKPMQVYVDEDEIKRLKKLAIDMNVSLSTLLRAIIKTYLSKHKVVK